MTIWIPYPYRPGFFPDYGVPIEICTGPDRMPSDPAGVEVFVPPLLASGVAVDMVARMPKLRLIQLLSAGVDAWLGRVPDGVTLCDARGVHNASTSEWALTAILAYLRQFHHFAMAQARAHWTTRSEIALTDELTGKRVMIIGYGAIGETLERKLLACDASVVRVARSARVPADGQPVHAISEIPDLLGGVDIVVLLVPLTVETTGMVDAAFLARMRDGALLVNAARGPIVDAAALLAELESGRIGAALDVTDPEPLPDGHPLWSLPNVLITPHTGGAVQGLIGRAYELARAQFDRYFAGEPLENVVAGDY